MAKSNIRILDIIVFLLAVSTGLFFTINISRQTGSLVQVNAAGTKYEFSAKQNGTHSVQGEQGFTSFEIKDGKVRIIDSPCPNKSCINQGWKTPLVCLPNNVIITLTTKGEFDGLSE